MKFKTGIYLLLSLVFLLFLPSSSECAEITKLDITIEGDTVNVETALSLDEKYIDEIRNGIKKELRFYIDIFKMWNVWPDEFITGKIYVRTLHFDPVKTEYISTLSDGDTIIVKRFSSFESMLKWALRIQNYELSLPKDLEPGAYFVRVIVESKIRQLPPVISDLLIFIPKSEFKIERDSSIFYIGNVK